MLDFDLYHVTIHPVLNWDSEPELQVGAQKIQILKGVTPAPDFGVGFEGFARKLTETFDATYEYDSSFGFFLNGESISGQIGATESDQLSFIELHQCKSAESFDAVVGILNQNQKIGIQILELGAFVSHIHYNWLLRECI